MSRQPVSMVINGEEVAGMVEPRVSLADFIRDQAQLTGTHLGCEHGVCGACTVQVDGVTVRSCLMLAVQCDGAQVQTVEGLADAGGADLQAAFVAHNALQCGFCTPGMLITAQELLSHSPDPSREEVRDALSGNYCRCTGYQSIVEAVLEVARTRRSA